MQKESTTTTDNLENAKLDYEDIENAKLELKQRNPNLNGQNRLEIHRKGELQKVLIANRGEIAKRFILALQEEGIFSVAVVADEDKGQSWFEFANQVVYIGEARNYADISIICAAVLESGANAVYPGYGFLSENYVFVERLKEIENHYKRKIIFMGPKSSVMRKVGNKLDARKLAIENGVPLFLGSNSIQGLEEAKLEAEKIGFPVILKLDAGGGGKGMLVIRSTDELAPAIESAKRIGKNSYGNETFYLEKFVEKPAHFEVQIFNGVAVGIRKCAVQRRNQKIIEESGESFINHRTQLQLLSNAEKFAEISGYSDNCGAGTVEFLLDRESGQFGFLEMNTRLQVEYTVTDLSLGIDLAKWQIFLFDNRPEDIQYNTAMLKRFGERSHSIQCRIYAEDPFQNYSPSPGKIKDLELPTFNGIRCDFGFKKGDRIPGDFDPMVGKLISFGKDRKEALLRMERALSELFIRGITTNIEQLLLIMRNEEFREGNYDNRLLDDYKELTIPNRDFLEEAILYLCVGEAIRISGEAVIETFRDRDLTKIVHSNEDSNTPLHFKILNNEITYNIFVLRTGLNEFWIAGDVLPLTLIRVSRYSKEGNQFLVESDNRSISVRIDKKPNFQLVRFTSKYDGKLHYARVNIKLEEGKAYQEEMGFLRSPFQGTFVKLFDDPKTNLPWSKGSIVSKDDPLIMISAMKMETILKSPIDGVLEYIIEDGNVSKLVRGKTASGQILGKSFSEGEVLSRITPKDPLIPNPVSSTDMDKETLTHCEFSVLKNWNMVPVSEEESPDLSFKQHFNTIVTRNEILRILYSWIFGFSQGKLTNTKIDYLIENLNIDLILENPIEKKEWSKFINTFVKFNVSLRRLFSSDIGSMHSHFGELQRSLLNWDTEGFMPFRSTSKLLTKVFSYYNVKAWTNFRRRPDQGEAFYFLVSAFNTQNDGREIFAKILEKLSPLIPNSKSTILNLRILLSLEEREREPKFESTIRKILGRNKNVQFDSPDGMRTLSNRHVNTFISFKKDPWSIISALESEKKALLDSFEKDLALVPKNLPENFQLRLNNKINFWQGRGKVKRLIVPIPNYFLYLFQSNSGLETSYILFSFMEPDVLIPNKETNSNIHCPELETQIILAASLIQSVCALKSVTSVRLEFLTFANESLGEQNSLYNKTEGYFKLLNSAHATMEFFLHSPFDSITLEIENSINNSSKFKTYSFFFRDGKLRIDSIGKDDIRFPYSIEHEKQNSKLYEKGKWPLERWIDETFDDSFYQEILIPNLDFYPEGKELDIKTSVKIGAKIFLGNIADKEAVFFLKDSRIAGGATGDKEGKKYLAAAYIAYRKNLPLYVWNDGAGANIKEGMVSLNRASEGFFITALLTHRVKFKEFLSAIESHNDSEISKFLLNLELIPGFNFISYDLDESPSNCFVVAVGVGSSTGLDVYGSSQASVQVLLDEDQSYRVLTGASVIESVTGESLTNYEIGGARVMGHGTGTVDFVANDKLHLISFLYQIQSILTQNEIKDFKLDKESINNAEFSNSILSESKLKKLADSNQFLSIKENYSGSESLVAGVLSLGGTPIVALGPRTEFGFHSLPALVKAKEAIKLAYKANTGCLLVYGSKWFRSNYIQSGSSHRVRRDFHRLLQKFHQTLIHIVKHSDGLMIPELSSQGDVWIWIQNSVENSKLTRNIQVSNPEHCATIVVNTEAEAFLKASQIFNLLHFREIKNFTKRHSFPKLPSETNIPYDMEKQIIGEILDDQSFIEFYKKDPGKSLITGLGRIEGKTIGIIADQPKDGGAPDAHGTEKFRIFMEFLSKHDIPLLMLSDSPGFVPGTKQERLRIQQIGGESLDVNVMSKNPIVSIVLRQNYGGRQIHAFSGFLRPGITYLSWEEGTLAVMGAHSAFDLFQGANVSLLRADGKEEEIEKLRNEFLETYKEKSKAKNDAMSSHVLDGVYSSIQDLRSVVVTSLAQSKVKKDDWKKKERALKN